MIAIGAVMMALAAFGFLCLTGPNVRLVAVVMALNLLMYALCISGAVVLAVVILKAMNVIA